MQRSIHASAAMIVAPGLVLLAASCLHRHLKQQLAEAMHALEQCLHCEQPTMSASWVAPPGKPLHLVGLSKDKTATTKRENYIDWHDYFMSVALLSAFRSKDPNRQVGACIINPTTLCIVGIGYNGFPLGCSDIQLPWARTGAGWLNTKYPYVCHAEVNAILNKNSESLRACRMYVTLFPCNECAKLIIQSRIEEVVYLTDGQKDSDAMRASRKMFQLAGVKVRQHTPAAPRVIIDFDRVTG
jgi:dCMP deaminase